MHEVQELEMASGSAHEVHADSIRECKLEGDACESLAKARRPPLLLQALEGQQRERAMSMKQHQL